MKKFQKMSIWGALKVFELFQFLKIIHCGRPPSVCGKWDCCLNRGGSMGSRLEKNVCEESDLKKRRTVFGCEKSGF